MNVTEVSLAVMDGKVCPNVKGLMTKKQNLVHGKPLNFDGTTENVAICDPH